MVAERTSSRDKESGEIVGLIPAAGRANRLAPLPFSKELYPIGSMRISTENDPRPRPACHYLLEKMCLANIAKAYIVIRQGKWDIPGYFQDGSILGMHLGYLIVGETSGPPYTLDAAYPFVRDAIVAFGFPDILFEGDRAFHQLLQARCNAEVVLGLFPADQPEKMDMIAIDGNGRVTDLVIQPLQTKLKYSWDVAIWTPDFTEFMHEYLAAREAHGSNPTELSVGHVIQAAIREGMPVDGVVISDQPYCDIGTADGLVKAIRRFGSLP